MSDPGTNRGGVKWGNRGPLWMGCQYLEPSPASTCKKGKDKEKEKEKYNKRKERKGKERKGKERKGKERKGKERGKEITEKCRVLYFFQLRSC
jgi:hypothetical protein